MHRGRRWRAAAEAVDCAHRQGNPRIEERASGTMRFTRDRTMLQVPLVRQRARHRRVLPSTGSLQQLARPPLRPSQLASPEDGLALGSFAFLPFATQGFEGRLAAPGPSGRPPAGGIQESVFEHLIKYADGDPAAFLEVFEGGIEYGYDRGLNKPQY